MLYALPNHSLKMLLWTLLMAIPLYSGMGEKRVVGVPRPISGDISDFAWTPEGTHLLIGYKSKKELHIYKNYNGALSHESTFKTVAPVVKIAFSAAQNSLAVGLNNGMVEFFSVNETGISSEDSKRILPQHKELHELSWIGDSPYVLVYRKDREPNEPGIDTHYAHMSVLRIFDSRNGELAQEFTLPHHVLKIEIAPSGRLVAIVMDSHNRKTHSLSLEEQASRQQLHLFSLSENLNAQQVLQTPYLFEGTISGLAWSPDSTYLAALLDTGELSYFTSEGRIEHEYSLPQCKRITGSISWSPIHSCISIPATLDTVQIFSRAQSEPIENISLADYVLKSDPQKPLYATKLAWSPSEDALAILCVDMGYGSASSQKKLIVVPTKIPALKKIKRSNESIAT